ncbi:GNAT family N-acetyltransferase [Leifsonia sp. AG29]|uniref:GNAT family N-acetyltransferase n=1 Tax=Leifsonia sp. AG29 TaxID=2598860 RepID=UPI00131D38C0|nr:GNAT family N-acetyltransferase [Leifsonia sp. AG29]
MLRKLCHPGLVPPVSATERSTPRLLLRTYRMTDADDWLEIEHDEAIRQGLGWPQRTTVEALAHLRARTHHTVLRRPGDLLVLAAEHEGHTVGDVSLHLRTVAAATRTVEIGWLLRSAYGGRGLATEAADAMLDVAFEHVQAVLVTAVVKGWNESSAKLAVRLGFRLVAQRGEFTTYVLSWEDRQLAHRTVLRERRGASADPDGVLP